MAHVLASSTHRAFILGESMFQKGFRSLWFFTCIFCILSQFRMPRCLPFDGLPFNLYELICASSLLIKVFWLDERAKSQNSHHVQIWNSGTRMPHLSWSRHTKVWESWSSSTKTALFSIKLYTQIKGKNENKKSRTRKCMPTNVFKKQPNWWLADFSIWADVPSSCGCLLETILSCLAFKQLTLFRCFSSKSTSGLIFRSALDFHKRYETKQDFEHNDEKETKNKNVSLSWKNKNWMHDACYVLKSLQMCNKSPFLNNSFWTLAVIFIEALPMPVSHFPESPIF